MSDRIEGRLAHLEELSAIQSSGLESALELATALLVANQALAGVLATVVAGLGPEERARIRAGALAALQEAGCNETAAGLVTMLTAEPVEQVGMPGAVPLLLQ